MINSSRTLRCLRKLPQNIKILRLIKMVNKPTVKMIKAEVIRGPKMDPPLTPKLEITAAITAKVATSASSLRADILLC